MRIPLWHRRRPYRDWHDVTTICTDYAGLAEARPTLVRVVRDFIGRHAEPLACALATAVSIVIVWRVW